MESEGAHQAVSSGPGKRVAIPAVSAGTSQGWDPVAIVCVINSPGSKEAEAVTGGGGRQQGVAKLVNFDHGLDAKTLNTPKTPEERQSDCDGMVSSVSTAPVPEHRRREEGVGRKEKEGRRQRHYGRDAAGNERKEDDEESLHSLSAPRGVTAERCPFSHGGMKKTVRFEEDLEGQNEI